MIPVLRRFDDVLAIVLQAESVEGDVFPFELDGQGLQQFGRADLLVQGIDQNVAPIHLAEGDVAVPARPSRSPEGRKSPRGHRLEAQAVGIQDQPLLAFRVTRDDPPSDARLGPARASRSALADLGVHDFSASSVNPPVSKPGGRSASQSSRQASRRIASGRSNTRLRSMPAIVAVTANDEPRLRPVTRVTPDSLPSTEIDTG